MYVVPASTLVDARRELQIAVPNRPAAAPLSAWRTKSYYALLQVVQTTPRGAERVEPTDVEFTELGGEHGAECDFEYYAALSGNQLVVHLANGSSEPLRYVFSWPIEDPMPTDARIGGRMTGPLSNNEELPAEPIERQGAMARLVGEVPANSLVTRMLPLGGAMRGEKPTAAD